ncbi:hypothetical protein [Methylacidimicrobium cyclopophantes]|uniref:hypothetical protein n=1 Tax=Methylacidimicrobium cyclopophantes TaxID=1041766 RepID=UPI001FE349D5|nr:hypothetical protein [Methylacidimicrobium cyclopophantes]
MPWDGGRGRGRSRGGSCLGLWFLLGPLLTLLGRISGARALGLWLGRLFGKLFSLLLACGLIRLLRLLGGER